MAYSPHRSSLPRLSKRCHQSAAKSRPRGFHPRFEHLENRRLLTGCPPQAAGAALVVPEMHSNPGATTAIYLDFDGHCEANFKDGQDAITPAFESTGRPGGIQEQIIDIWEHVAEDFAPFDVDVTTEEPDGRFLRVAIGGRSTDWFDAPQTNSGINGVAFGHAFTPGNRNVVYVFERHSGETKHVADTASHEAGHAFKLDHQTISAPRPSPTITKAALMGHSHSADRGIWWSGLTEHGQRQADVSILNRELGPRTDDHGDNLRSATRLQQTPSFQPFAGTDRNRLFGRGIIESHDDQDWFAFTVQGAGQIVIEISAGEGIDVDQAAVSDQGNANLDLEFTVRTVAGDAVAHLTTDRLGESYRIAAVPLALPNTMPTLEVGNTYFLEVVSHGSYGDLGNYTVTVDGPVGFGPKIINADLAPSNLGWNSQPVQRVVDQMWITFDQPVNPQTIDSTDIQLFDPRGNQIRINSVSPLNSTDPRTFEINFPTQSLSGDYQVTIGPEIQGQNGVRLMDQDGDGNGGEPLEDRFVFGFSIRGGFHDLRDLDTKLDKLEVFGGLAKEAYTLPDWKQLSKDPNVDRDEFFSQTQDMDELFDERLSNKRIASSFFHPEQPTAKQPFDEVKNRVVDSKASFAPLNFAPIQKNSVKTSDLLAGSSRDFR